MANLIDFNIKQLTIIINDSLRAHNGCNNFPKDGSRYISALKKFVYYMPTFSDRGRGKGSKHTRCLECINFTIFSF